MASSDLELILTTASMERTDEQQAEYIDKLEGLIQKYNLAAQKGEELVSDAVYDVCIDILREVNPDSPLLTHVWSADDTSVPLDENLDKYLMSYPMLSIQTIKSLADKPVRDFKERLPYNTTEAFVAIKENGHGWRVVWLNGHLVKATSRGRSTNGRDLTAQAKLILGDFAPDFESAGLVEMRGEILLPFSNLEEARTYNPNIKSAFSGVSSMLRDSATVEETRLLEGVFYDIYSESFDTEFETLEGKYQFIEDCGFKVPIFFTWDISPDTLETDIENIVHRMDVLTSDYDYFTDGVIVAINDLKMFQEFGEEDKYRFGNLAIKMGRWKQDSYSGIVQTIKWEDGKTKKTPVAVIEGVLTASGSTVTNVPLYAPAYILMLEAYPGRVIHFRYGGESGVIPVTADGRLVTDKSFN